MLILFRVPKKSRIRIKYHLILFVDAKCLFIWNFTIGRHLVVLFESVEITFEHVFRQKVNNDGNKVEFYGNVKLFIRVFVLFNTHKRIQVLMKTFFYSFLEDF